MTKIVIIGTGLAGYTLAKELRKHDNEVEVCLISKDHGEFYSKPLLSNALAKGKTPAQIATATAEQMAEQYKLEIHANSTVHSLDTKNKTIQLSNAVIHYDKLVLALGAAQIDAGLQGNAVSQVFTVNNLQEYQDFRQRLESATRVAIVGTGLIGCEFANDLLAVNKQVTVIGPGETPLGRLLPYEVGLYVKNELANGGIKWALGSKAESLEQRDDRLKLVLNNGHSIDTDVVLSAVGLRPQLVLADQAGLRTNNGIVVDDFLQTSAADVYALGDCAEIHGQVQAFVLPIMHCARALAATLTGQASKLVFPPMPVVVKTPLHGMVVLSPMPHQAGDWRIESVSGGMRALFYDAAGNLAGFALTGTVIVERQKLVKEIEANKSEKK